MFCGWGKGKWTSCEVFEQINSLLNHLAAEDLNAMPAEAMDDDQIALQRICNRVQAEGLRRLRRFDSGRVMPLLALSLLERGCAGS